MACNFSMRPCASIRLGRIGAAISLAYSSQDRFADAVASPEKIDLQSNDFWTKFYSLQVLLLA
ncbi:MAG: hypothetical protein E5Y58_04395 [Mesorhizobium sp.]|nr:MAG: hypothetical protein E5Y58_04395 [Mesorhizobium sp.]